MDCDTCGRTHRTPEAILACEQRAEKKAKREEKKQADTERRIENWKKEPPEVHIKRLRNEGKIWEHIVASLNRDYPPPQGKRRWDLWETVGTYAEELDWPGLDAEQKTLLLLEKHHVGMFISLHPTELIRWPDGVLTPSQIVRALREEYDVGLDPDLP